jgi:hypothetical protein
VAKAEALSRRSDERPYVAATFRVRVSGTASARRAAGLSVARIEWGPFPVAQSEVPTTPVLGTDGGLPAQHVLLRRGVTGATDLADWWRIDRAPKRSAARTVVVDLLDSEVESPVLTWTFRGCRVVQLSHSPLDALEATVITETLVFVYADVDIAIESTAEK